MNCMWAHTLLIVNVFFLLMRSWICPTVSRIYGSNGLNESACLPTHKQNQNRKRSVYICVWIDSVECALAQYLMWNGRGYWISAHCKCWCCFISRQQQQQQQRVYVVNNGIEDNRHVYYLQVKCVMLLIWNRVLSDIVQCVRALTIRSPDVVYLCLKCWLQFFAHSIVAMRVTRDTIFLSNKWYLFYFILMET